MLERTNLNFSLFVQRNLQTCPLSLDSVLLFLQNWKGAIDVALAMSGSEAVVESYKVSYEDTVSSERSIDTHLCAKNECGLEFSNAVAVPGNNQRCGNPLVRRRQGGWTTPPSASSIPRSKRPCHEQVCSWKQSS